VKLAVDPRLLGLRAAIGWSQLVFSQETSSPKVYTHLFLLQTIFDTIQDHLQTASLFGFPLPKRIGEIGGSKVQFEVSFEKLRNLEILVFRSAHFL